MEEHKTLPTTLHLCLTVVYLTEVSLTNVVYLIAAYCRKFDPSMFDNSRFGLPILYLNAVTNVVHLIAAYFTATSFTAVGLTTMHIICLYYI